MARFNHCRERAKDEQTSLLYEAKPVMPAPHAPHTLSPQPVLNGLRRLRWMRRFRMMVVQVGSQVVSNDCVPGHGGFEKSFLHVAGEVRP